MNFTLSTLINMEVVLNEGFVRANSRNVPYLRTDIICKFLSTRIASANEDITRKLDLVIDFVQVRNKKGENCIIKGFVFSQEDLLFKSNEFCEITIVINDKRDEIISGFCEYCDTKILCPHITEFIFWLSRNCSTPEYKTFWNIGNYDEGVSQDKVELNKLLKLDSIKREKDLSAEEGDYFVQLLLNEMEKMNLTESCLYSHFRIVEDELEPLYIHNAMIEHKNNSIFDFRSFSAHMEDVASRGLFLKLMEVSGSHYKRKLWIETQYGRIRCSLMYAVLNRQSEQEDDAIINSVLCLNREERIPQKQLLKNRKRYILTQTEKLENKEYRECGLLLNETYPFICASPDGITDDHIVEIKIPKSEEDFENYLVGKDTIAPKYMAQMQTQMYLANVQKALFCVLSPDFDTNGSMHYVWVRAELQQVANLLSAAEEYWKDVIYKRLEKIYMDL